MKKTYYIIFIINLLVAIFFGYMESISSYTLNENLESSANINILHFIKLAIIYSLISIFISIFLICLLIFLKRIIDFLKSNV